MKDVEETSNIFDMQNLRLALDASDANWMDTPITNEEVAEHFSK